MKRNNNTALRLKEYALLASAVLSGFKANSEVVYTNPEPDDTLQFNNDLAYIDFDFDDNPELLFKMFKFNITTSYYGHFYKIQLTASPQGDAGNAIAGSFFTIGSVMYSSVQTYRPYLIPDNYNVGFMLSFQDNLFQVMGYLSTDLYGNTVDIGGHWVSEHSDVYVGVRFKAVDDHMHYGWVRCSLVGTLDALIIHDFAFEGIPEKSIRTGDMTGTATSDIQATNWISVSTNGSELSIQIDQYIQNTVELNIYDLNGRLISNTSHTPGNHQLHLDAPTGTYIVTAITSDKQFTQKIMIN